LEVHKYSATHKPCRVAYVVVTPGTEGFAKFEDSNFESECRLGRGLHREMRLIDRKSKRTKDKFHSKGNRNFR
jgi:hypothetical protein